MSKPKISMRTSPLNDGTCPLIVTFRHKGKQFREPIGMYAHPDEWDEERREFKGRSKEIKARNLRLAKHIDKANEIITYYFLRQAPLTPQNFKAEFHSLSSRECFVEYMKQEINSQYHRRLFSQATRIQKMRTVEKLREFMYPFPFGIIDRKVIEQFDEWHAKLLHKRGYEGLREREKALKYIKEYLLSAKAEGKEFVYPFDNFRFPKPKYDFTWLEINEVEELLKLFNEPEVLRERMRLKAEREEMRSFDVGRYTSDKSVNNIREHLRGFLIMCFLGVRYSDLCRLNWGMVEKEMIVFTPEKTKDTSGKVVYFPLTDLLRDLFLPAPGKMARTVSNQKANKQLKIISELAGINKKITTHVGRHTFGSLMVAQGVSLVSLMELMGVTSIRTVMNYAHSSYDQQKKELSRAQAEFNVK